MEESIVGKKFRDLIVLSQEKRNKYNQPMVKCKCKCGNIFVTRQTYLTRKKKSISHCRACTAVHNFTTHNMSKTRIYQCWKDMKARCDNIKNAQYKDYGGRNITYNSRWENFENFYDDMIDTYKEHLTLDRIDVNKNYCKENCRWISKKIQNRNKRNNRVITYNGVSKPLVTWAEDLNISVQTLHSRLNKLDWPVERALTTRPLRRQ